jgi:hypothetical protein
MRTQATLAPLASPADAIGTPSPMLAPHTEAHGWLNTETLKTPFGDFAFENGYAAGDTAERLRALQRFNLATEVYLTQR